MWGERECVCGVRGCVCGVKAIEGIHLPEIKVRQIIYFEMNAVRCGPVLSDFVVLSECRTLISVLFITAAVRCIKKLTIVILD